MSYHKNIIKEAVWKLFNILVMWLWHVHEFWVCYIVRWCPYNIGLTLNSVTRSNLFRYLVHITVVFIVDDNTRIQFYFVFRSIVETVRITANILNTKMCGRYKPTNANTSGLHSMTNFRVNFTDTPWINLKSHCIISIL